MVTEMDENKSIIELLEDDFVQTVEQFKKVVPELIGLNKPMQAIQARLNFDSHILEIHRQLTEIYLDFCNNIRWLGLYKAAALESLLNRKIIHYRNVWGTDELTNEILPEHLYKTFGIYMEELGSIPENVDIDILESSEIKVLGQNFREDMFVKDSTLKRLIFIEIQYMIYVLKDVVEKDWGIEVESVGSNSDMPDRFIPKTVKFEVWRRDQGKCVECGSNERLEFDHIIPVSKGGSNTARNIQLLCENCNRSKGAEIA